MNEKISFYTPPFPRIKSYFDMVDLAKEYDVSSVEGFCTFEFSEPDISSAKKLREYADSKGIKFPCFSVLINLAGDDRKKQIERLKGFADVSALLGSPYLHHTIVCDFSEPNNVVPYSKEFFKRGIDAVREVYDYAESIGIRTIYEDQGYLFNGIEGFGNFLAEINRNVGVVADFGNIYQVGGNIIEFINAFSDRVVHAHIKDITLTAYNETGCGLKTLSGMYMNEAEIGEGCVPVKEGMELLKKNGYSGYYGIEYAASSNECKSIENALRLVDSLI